MDTELDILIRAISDEKSADEATKQLVNRVFSKLKDGAIKLPINSKLDKSELKKLDDNVKQARKEVVSRYNKLQKDMADPKGFDAFSEKAINELVELGKAYAKFNSKASGQSKNSTKAISDVKATLGEVFQLYENELKLLNSKIKELNLQDKVSRQLSSTRSRRSSKSAEAYDRYLTKQEQHSKRAEGAGKRKELFNELDEVRKEKSQYPQHIIRGVATKKTLQETEYSGSYPSGFARQTAKSRRKARKRELASLRVEKNKEKAEQHAKDLEEGKVKYETKRRVIDKKPNGQWDVRYEDAEVYNKKPKQYTNEENNELKRDVTTNELAKILGGLEHRRKDASVQLFKNYMSGAFAFNTAAGKNDWDVIRESLEKTLNRYRGDKGTLGITDGTEKGVFEGHEEAVAAIEEMLDYMDEIIKQSEEQGKISVENARVLKELAKIDPKAANKYADELLGVGQQNTNSSNTVEPNSPLAKEIATMTSATEETHSAIRNSTKETGKVNRSVKIGNTKTAVEFDQAEKISKENKDINRDTAKSVKANETTGFDTDESSNRLIKVVEDIRDNLSKAKEATSKIELPAGTKDLYKALPDPNRLLGLPKPDGRRKKISDGMKDENPQLGLIPVQDAMKKSLAVIPNEFAKTLKESIHPSVKDTQQKIDRPEGKNEFKYDETMLRRLAAISNAGKEARRKQSMDYTPPPRTIIPDYQPRVKHSDIYASPIKTTLRDTLENFLNDLTGASAEYKKIVNASTEQQDKMAAERVKIWGMNNGRNPNDTGDIASMRRVLELYRNNKDSIEQNPELMQKIKLTDPIEIDTTEVTKAFNEALSGKNMRNAQMGGSVGKQILGAMRGFTFMPSIEKSRAQADGLNQILGIINKSLNSLLSNIQMHETTLAGMEESGQARFNPDGTLTEDSTSAAKKTLADLEESKYVLEMLKADLLANEEIVKRTGNNYGQMIKQLSFASPILRDCNGILRNMNAGLDKNGKALKFQTRMAEILNYTFQLMSRSIGQWFKQIISMLNPLNIMKNTIKTITGWVKSAFQDFGSYDTKWQRTMNVIKINFQRSIKPAMEWIAQKLVNIIGFFNIISMKIQEAFGQIPVDLFDQAGANAEKLRRELEEAANVTAGFDELHDIGSDNSGANDLMGDIYKPQLSQDWIDMATKLGETLGGFFKGDLGFGDVCKVILELLGKLLGTIGKMIWDWFKETSLGKWITEHWKGLLATLLALFVGWELLKIFGPTLLSTIGGAFKTLIGKVGGWLATSLGSTKVGTAIFSFGSGMVEALKGALTGKAGFLTTMKSIFVGHDAITAFGAWGETLGGLFVQALGIALGGAAVAKGFDMVADDASYNMGLMESGGKKEDQKSGAGGKVLGAIGGAAIGAFLVGGPLAIGIGAIAGLIVTSLAPAFEELAVKAKDANNEMQKIEYYEGKVQGYSTQVNNLTELQKVLNDTLRLQTEKVYEEGEQLGITKTRMDELVGAVQNGTFYTGMLSGAEVGLKDSLIQLDAQQEKNRTATEKLEAAKRKLQKAELDLAIAEDVAAGNFEMAAARVEYAVAAEIYDVEEGTKKMVQIAKEGSAEQATAMLRDMSPDLQAKFQKEYSTTEKGLDELTDLYFDYSKDEREYFLQNLTGEVQREMQERVNAIKQAVENAPWWKRLLDIGNDGKIFGKYYVDIPSPSSNTRSYVPSMAVGANYVPNDGLAYLHQGEAVIPKKYNQPYQQQGLSGEEKEYMAQMIKTMKSLDGTIQQGINVKGQFVQRGSDLVATVEKANSKLSNNILNNKVYAR